MFAVIYRFKVKESLEADFTDAWKELTQLIYEHEGSLGSRLHRQQDGIFLAYAQWPDRPTWKNSGKNLPGSAEKARRTMRETCDSIETLYELDCVEDLLSTIKHLDKTHE